jgi:hypothetical protein
MSKFTWILFGIISALTAHALPQTLPAFHPPRPLKPLKQVMMGRAM